MGMSFFFFSIFLSLLVSTVDQLVGVRNSGYGLGRYHQVWSRVRGRLVHEPVAVVVEVIVRCKVVLIGGSAVLYPRGFDGTLAHDGHPDVHHGDDGKYDADGEGDGAGDPGDVADGAGDGVDAEGHADARGYGAAEQEDVDVAGVPGCGPDEHVLV